MYKNFNAEYGGYVGVTLYVTYIQVIHLQNYTHLISVAH